MDEMERQPDQPIARVSNTITLRDLLIFGVTLVSIVVAWGVNETRVSLIEQKMEQHFKIDEMQDVKLADLAQEVNNLETKVIQLEYVIDQNNYRLGARIKRLEEKTTP